MEKPGIPNYELYNPETEELRAKRIKCKLLCQKYNNIQYDKFEEKKAVIKELLGKTQDKFFIEQPFYCDYGSNIEIGENFYSNHNLVILDPAQVTFGNNIFIGPNVGIYTAEHPLDYETRNKSMEYAEPIRIGNNVWIGGGVNILSGVTIGNNVVIASGAVVTKDVPDDVLVGGVPAKVIKQL